MAMTNRPTPETDEVHRQNRLPSTSFDLAYRYLLDLSRRLERERDEARKLLADESRDARKIFEELERAVADRDQAWERVQESSMLGVNALIRVEDLRQELAAERALADRLGEELQRLIAYDLDVKIAYLNSSNAALAAWKEARK